VRFIVTTALIAGYLVVAKYIVAPFSNFEIASQLSNIGFLTVAVPLGLSYLTFRLLDYHFTTSSGRMPPHSATDFAFYVVFLPIFAAGPIQRFDRFLTAQSGASFLEDARVGVGRIVLGIVKAFAIPMLLLQMVGFYEPGQLLYMLGQVTEFTETWRVWLELWVLVVYFYLNFAGYNDIAIGSARVLGYRIDENMNNPLLSTNMIDFWRRWHITLGDWCRSYVFLPTSRLTRSVAAGTISTFVVIGLWHEASLGWLVWGLVHAVSVLVSVEFLRRGWHLGIPPMLRAIFGNLFVQFVLCVAAAFSFSASNGGVFQAFRILRVAFMVP
jgi:alginate O-acetyltransferase complex protein AlgI